MSTSPARAPGALRTCLGAMAAGTLLAGGCAPAPVDDPWPSARPIGRDLPIVRPPADPDERLSTGFEEPSGVLTLRDALGAALLGSPRLIAMGYEVRVREAEAIQAGVLPNPEIGLEVENFGGTGAVAGFGAAETTLALSQLIELGGDRVRRRRVAEQNTRLAAWDDELARIDVLTRTAGDFVRLVGAERRLEIATEREGLAERVLRTVGLQVEAGRSSPLERTRSDVELARARLDRERAALEVAERRVRLAANWGSTAPRFDGAEGRLEQLVATPALEDVLALVHQNPDVARWAAEAALRQAEIDLAIAQGVPDLEIGGGIRYLGEIDDTAFVVGLSAPLPVFDRNAAGTRAARLRAIQAGYLERSALVEVRTGVAEAYARIATAHAEVRALRDEVVPGARAVFEAGEEAFRLGKIGSLELLDAQRTLFESSEQLIEAEVRYHLAVIAAERLIGAPLADAGIENGGGS